MTTANKNNVITRAEKTSPLTYNEMDNNFLELKNAIDDIGNNESAITAITTALSGTGGIDDRLTSVENSLSSFMVKSQNLNDLTDKTLARTNLAVYSKTESDARYLNEAANLSDIDNAANARTNLGIGDIATRDLFVSTSEPNNSNGSDGDIWLTYV